MGIETASLEEHFKSQNVDYMYVKYLTVSLTSLKDLFLRSGGSGFTGHFACLQNLTYCYKK